MDILRRKSQLGPAKKRCEFRCFGAAKKTGRLL